MSGLKNPYILLLLMVAFHLVALTPVPNKEQRAQRIVGKACAIVVDMQPVYLANIDEKEFKREMANILDTMEFCHRNGIPIIALEIKDAGSTIEEIKDELDRYGARIIKKNGNSGFEDTVLEPELKRLRVDSLILMGVNASVCVRSTAEDALERGFSICTSKQLMAEPGEWKPGVKTYESIVWFARNGIYCDRYRDLLHVIANSPEYVDGPFKPIPIAMSF